MNDLDQLVRDAGRDLTRTTPLAEVESRGQTLRHRRCVRRGGICAAAAVAAVGGLFAAVAATDSGTADAPGTTTGAAGWSKSLIGLPDEVSDD